MLKSLDILFGAVLVVGSSAVMAEEAMGPLPDPTHIPFILPDNIPWKGTAGREQTYMVVGDTSQPGMYIQLLKWYPGNFSRPHFHPNVRYITVLSGHWWVSSSNVYDPGKTYPLPSGTLAQDLAKTVHWDGAKNEPVILEVVGEGPADNLNVDEQGNPLPPRNPARGQQ